MTALRVGAGLIDNRYGYGTGPRTRSIGAQFLGAPATKTAFDYVGFGALRAAQSRACSRRRFRPAPAWAVPRRFESTMAETDTTLTTPTTTDRPSASSDGT